MSSNYAKSYEDLGYSLRFNQEWSAENSKGVCISLWTSELAKREGVLFDTRLHCDPVENWEKSNNTKRIKMLIKADELYEGWLDVVIRDDANGRNGAPTEPWKLEERDGQKWRLTYFDSETGHFAAKPQKF